MKVITDPPLHRKGWEVMSGKSVSQQDNYNEKHSTATALGLPRVAENSYLF